MKLIKEYITPVIDTAHILTVFRDPLEEIEKLRRYDYRILKLHLSNPLVIRNNEEELELFSHYAKLLPYSHHRRGIDKEGKIVHVQDTPLLIFHPLEREKQKGVEEFRFYMHLPIYQERLTLRNLILAVIGGLDVKYIMCETSVPFTLENNRLIKIDKETLIKKELKFIK